MGGVVEHPSVPEHVYAKIPVDDLVLYAAKQVLDSGEECTSERLVYECFTLFPKQFCLQRYPQWPDSARVNKSWWRCRTDKGWLAGNVKEGFKLTDKGERVVAIVEKKLSLARPTRRKQEGQPRERFEAILRHVRSTTGFRRYKDNPADFASTDTEVRSLLGGTLETPLVILKQNLHLYLDAAQQYEDREVEGFLEALKHLLRDWRKK